MIESTNYAQYVANLRGIAVQTRPCARSCWQSWIGFTKCSNAKHRPTFRSGPAAEIAGGTGGTASPENGAGKGRGGVYRQVLGFEYYGEGLFDDHFEGQAIIRFVFDRCRRKLFTARKCGRQYEAIKKDFEPGPEIS